ncbi:MAG: hypothetical protein Unbinned5350contig1001_52 [Prokaryotic dsDNA virus sp.]|nr:MAG: hypothetical protein Unbinned5350contig1001_52 [Prokaryotic dsDNA virus sp.]|tara:strand:- start:3762 stop:4718 length:957 start_codon:yes stop_codon:yes gene_type:complete
MLEKEIIISDPLLKDLTTEQIAALEKMSANDEQTTIDANRSKFWKAIDNDVEGIFGVGKTPGVKTHEILKQVLTDAKEKAGKTDELNTKLSANQILIGDLEKQLLAGGGDDVLKSQITKLEGEKLTLSNEVTSVKTSYQTKEQEYTQLLADREGDKVTFQLGSKFGEAEKGLKFNEAIPKAVIDRELEAARKRVLAKGKPVLAENGTFSFLDGNDVILKNPKKGLEPYTPGELLIDELTLSGILDVKRMKTGAGGGAPPPGGGGGSYVDLSSATTKVEAIGLIEKKVLENGTSKISPNFLKEVGEMAKANQVSETFKS